MSSGYLATLATLIAPLTPREFATDYWQKKPLGVHGSLDRFGLDLEVVAARSVEELVDQPKADPQAWFTDRYGNYRSITVERGAAKSLHAAGMTLYFDWDDPAFHPVIGSLESELGRKPMSGFLHMFASLKGDGVLSHYDQNETFTIQLRGHKRWKLSNRPQVPAPIKNWAPGTPAPPWLKQALPDGLPTTIPDDAEVFDLTPGSMLYTPAGHWHTTENVEDSLSIIFNLSGIGTWIDVLRPVFEQLLASDPALRAYAARTWTPAGRTNAVHAELDAALERARRLLRDVTSRDVWGPATDEPDGGAALAPTARLRRNRFGLLSINEAQAAHPSVVVSRDGCDDVLEIDLPPALLPLARWIRERQDGFSVSEARALVPSTDHDDVDGLLAALIAFAYLSMASR